LDYENVLIIIEDDGRESILPLEDGAVDGMKIDVIGKNNKVRITRRQKFFGCQLNIHGDRNTLDIEASLKPIHHSLFHFSPTGNDRVIKIGSGFSGIGHFRVVEDNSYIHLGNDCMFSWDVTIMASDYHTIYDKTGQVLNKAAGGVTLGNNIWVGCKSTILKNTQIGNGSIVGACSVVTRQFKDENCILAGNPAKIVKRDIRWSRASPDKAPAIAALETLDIEKEIPKKWRIFLQKIGIIKA
jgi:acetyltransferase-like isoleucine patch superfamily enzyme